MTRSDAENEGGTDIASWISSEKSMNIEMFNLAADARNLEHFDEAIGLYDACLTNDPEPTLGFLAWCSLARTIWDKFLFHENSGDHASHDVVRWSIRCGLCSIRGLDIYENKLANDPDSIEGLEEFSEDASNMAESGATYGAVEVSPDGEVMWRDIEALASTVMPPLECIAADENRYLESLRRGENMPWRTA